MECPVCNLQMSDDVELQLHVNAHFEEPEDIINQAGATSEPARVVPEDTEKENTLISTLTTRENDAPSARPTPGPEHIDDGRSRTINPLACLKGNRDLLLCSPCDHFSSSGRDRGFCGFKNLQMLLSAMKNHPPFNRVVFNGEDWFPSILKLQQLIEAAWSSGFDADGYTQLKGRLQHTKKWIGAVEVVTLLSSLSVQCRLVEFREPEADGTHLALYDWLLNYFQRQDAEFLCPVYLQHHGHSYTVVGIDMAQHGLLMLDPGCPPYVLRKLLHDPFSMREKLFYSVDELTKLQYQLAVVDGLMTTVDQFEKAKVLERICNRVT